MLKILKTHSKLFILILLVIFTSPSVLGLLHQGFPLTDDGNWMIVRFSAFYEALRNGQFPVRFLTRLNNGYGYPVADFLYPLFMYLGVPIHILGLNFTNTVKAILGLSLIFSSVFSYLWLRKHFDSISSFVGALAYTLFPYQLFDVYKRGSVGEVLSLAIVPLLLWQIERESIVFTSLSIALLIVAHNTLAFLFTPLIFVYILVRKKKQLRFAVFSFLFGIVISSFFWIPALYDTRYTVFAQTSVSNFYDYFIGLSNLDTLGIIFLITLISSAVVLKLGISKKRNFRLFLYSFTASLIITFFVFPVSKIVWQFIPFTNLIQFPFRLISLLPVLLAFQLGFILSLVKKRNKIVLSAVFLVLVYISAKPYITASDYQYLPDSFYSTNQGTTTVQNEYMPIWVKNIPVSMASQRVTVLGSFGGNVNMVNATPNRTDFQVNLSSPKTVQVNIVYFPGWTAYVNGKKADIMYENSQGLIRLNLDKGENNVSVEFQETPLRLFADFLSLLGIAGLLAIYAFDKKKL